MERIEINISEQQLYYYRNDTCFQKYRVSTAANGVGEQNGSEKTPRGKHYIRAKIGAGLPVNAVFRGRRFTGQIYHDNSAGIGANQDWILTRILWLSGLEINRNRLGPVDSMRRYIYIHGTPDSEPMGTPKSHGCIRMRNHNIVELFDWVSVGCPVNIIE